MAEGSTNMDGGESAADRISRLLVGSQVTRTIVGGGSILCLGFGRAVCGVPGRGDSPAVSLMAFCMWRLFENGTLVASWRDIHGARREHCLDALRRMLGQDVRAVRISNTVADMSIRLSHAVDVEILIDIADPDESADNYYLRGEAEVFTCAWDGALSSSN